MVRLLAKYALLLFWIGALLSIVMMEYGGWFGVIVLAFSAPFWGVLHAASGFYLLKNNQKDWVSIAASLSGCLLLGLSLLVFLAGGLHVRM